MDPEWRKVMKRHRIGYTPAGIKSEFFCSPSERTRRRGNFHPVQNFQILQEWYQPERMSITELLKIGMIA
jgi:hypothetical protein